MSAPAVTRFNSRAFVAMIAVFSGVSLPVSGLANHIYGFAPLSGARHAWMAAHNAMGILFAVFVVWHIAINRRAPPSHFRSTAAKLPRRETALAALIVAILLTLAAGHAFIAGGHA
jgi:hypothetical protein